MNLQDFLIRRVPQTQAIGNLDWGDVVMNTASEEIPAWNRQILTETTMVPLQGLVECPNTGRNKLWTDHPKARLTARIPRYFI